MTPLGPRNRWQLDTPNDIPYGFLGEVHWPNHSMIRWIGLQLVPQISEVPRDLSSQVPFIAPTKKSMVCYTLSIVEVFFFEQHKGMSNIYIYNSLYNSFWIVVLGITWFVKAKMHLLVLQLRYLRYSWESRWPKPRKITRKCPRRRPYTVQAPISGEKGTRRRRSFATSPFWGYKRYPTPEV